MTSYNIGRPIDRPFGGRNIFGYARAYVRIAAALPARKYEPDDVRVTILSDRSFERFGDLKTLTEGSADSHYRINVRVVRVPVKKKSFDSPHGNTVSN